MWDEVERVCRVTVEESWRRFMSEMWEDRWRAEDRKEIIGEEWRKISRILDRSAFSAHQSKLRTSGSRFLS